MILWKPAHYENQEEKTNHWLLGIQLHDIFSALITVHDFIRGISQSISKSQISMMRNQENDK